MTVSVTLTLLSLASTTLILMLRSLPCSAVEVYNTPCNRLSYTVAEDALLKVNTVPVLSRVIALAFTKAWALSDKVKVSVDSPVRVTVTLPMVALSMSLSLALAAMATPSG